MEQTPVFSIQVRIATKQNLLQTLCIETWVTFTGDVVTLWISSSRRDVGVNDVFVNISPSRIVLLNLSQTQLISTDTQTKRQLYEIQTDMVRSRNAFIFW